MKIRGLGALKSSNQDDFEAGKEEITEETVHL